MDKLKATEVIADAATPAVETAMQIGEKLAERLDKNVEVVFEIVEKTPMNVKKLILIGAGVVAVGAIVGTGYWYWSKNRRAKKVIIGETVENNVDDELNEMIKAEEAVAGTDRSKHKK